MADRQCQVDEVELLQAMMSREGEFEWREDERRRTISGTLSVFLQLEQPISLKLVRKPKPSSVQREVKSKTTVSIGKDLQSHSSPTVQLSVSELSSSSAAFAAATSLRKPPPSPESIKILHLPPLRLYFQFPPAYPSQDKPSFSLSCKWLNFTQVSSSLKIRHGKMDPQNWFPLELIFLINLKPLELNSVDSQWKFWTTPLNYSQSF